MLQLNNHWKHILLIALINSLSSSFHTTIISNYTEPPPLPIPTPTPLPPVADPPLQINVINLITTSTPLVFLEYQKNYSVSFNIAFTSNPQTAVMIDSLVDTNYRYGVHIELMLGSPTMNQVLLTYNDYSGPGSWQNCKLFRVRILSKKSALIPNLYFYYRQFEVYDQPITFSYSEPAIWNVALKMFPFVTKMILSVSNPLNFSYKINVPLTLRPPDLFQFYVDIPFYTPFNVSKIVGFFVIILKDDSRWIYTSGFVLFPHKYQSVNFTQSPSLYFIIGLYLFQIQNNATLNFELTNNSTTLKIPPNAADYQILYSYLIINDTSIITVPPPPPPPPIVRPETLYNITLTGLDSFSTTNTSFKLTYSSVPNIGFIQKSQLKTNFNTVWIESIWQIHDQLFVICGYGQNIHMKNIELQLSWIVNDVQFKARTSLLLQVVPQLKVYPFVKSSISLKKLAQVFQYLYLIGFLIASLNLKLVAIELISFLQLTYYSLIPLGLSNIGFDSIKCMKYNSGYNIFFPSLPNVPLPTNISTLNISSNFISNINLMLVPIIISPLLAITLFVASKLNNSYKHKPRLRQYAFACLFQWPYIIILFNSYNIYVSFMVTTESMKNSDPVALSLAVICSLLSPALVSIYYFLKQKYVQFQVQLNKDQKILCFSIEKSNKMFPMYPVVLAAEMMVLPLILSNSTILDYSLYICLTIVFILSLVLILMKPYLQKINNIRFFIHRILMMFLLGAYILCKFLIPKDDIQNPILSLIWIIPSILVLYWIVNIPFIIWKFILWIKKSGIVDMKLYVQQKGPSKRPKLPDNMDDPVWYPILEHGRGRKRLDQNKGQNVVYWKKNQMYKQYQQDNQNINQENLLDGCQNQRGDENPKFVTNG